MLSHVPLFNLELGKKCLLDRGTFSSTLHLVVLYCTVQVKILIGNLHYKPPHPHVWSLHHSVTLGQFTLTPKLTWTFNLPHTPGDGKPGPGAERLVHTALPVQKYKWKKYTSSINCVNQCKIFPTELLHTQMYNKALQLMIDFYKAKLPRAWVGLSLIYNLSRTWCCGCASSCYSWGTKSYTVRLDIVLYALVCLWV